MSRLTSMARFDESDTEPRVVAECDGEIYVGDATTSYENGAQVHEHCEADYGYAVDFVWYRGRMGSDGNVE